MSNNLQDKELKELKQQSYQTCRATVPEMEQILYNQFDVLDHGFIRVIDYMGDDNAIVQAARVSYGKGTKKLNIDRGLIRYLMRHWHTTPFEMCEIKLHVKLPIFVARQWIRHRTANVNEYSARYSILDREFYIPDPQHLAAQSKSNNQGRDDMLTGSEAAEVIAMLKADSMRCYDNYTKMLNIDDITEQGLDNNKQGLARELARINLPVNFYTQWYWKIDLNNLLHFLQLRADSHAQYEIKAYSDILLDIVAKWVPYTSEAFNDYRIGAVNFSAQAMTVLKRMLNGEKVTQENSALTKREWNEMMSCLEKN